MSRIAVIGSGYVGLTAGACFAHLGHHVLCADVDAAKVERLSRGDVPILEAGLPELVQEGLAARRLKFVVGAATAAATCEFAYLCVPTPQGPDGSADLSYLLAAATEIGPVLAPESVVVNKSTVPIGSTGVVEEALGRDDVVVVSNPEFLREGSAVRDFLHPDRIVIGADDQQAAARVGELYRHVQAPVIVTDPASAEMIKYASNAFLAAKVSFVNAVANVCEGVGADVRDVLLGMGYDRRIGFDFLKPGPGWGGSCFPKDVSALIRIAEDTGYEFDLLRAVAQVNQEQQDLVARKVLGMVDGDVDGALVGAWGLTFKARTDDLRVSPALAVIARLRREGVHVRAYDPAVHRPLDGIDVCADPYSACEGAAALVVLTEWDEFRRLDFAKVAGLLTAPRVVDARNLLDPAALRRLGFTYVGVGR
jgi:UDPglucose 6-dehydrogenase